MTLTIQTRKVIYTGNGVTTIFPYAFRIPQASQLKVYTRPIGGDLTQVFNYTATGIDNPNGGTVTYPTTGSPLPSTHEILIFRVMLYIQELDITNQDGFLPETLEDQLDFTEMQIQQLVDELSRAALFPVGTSGRTIENIPEGHLWRADFDGNMVDGGLGTVVNVELQGATESYPTLNGAGGAIASSPVTDIVEIHGYNTKADFSGTYARYKSVTVEPTTHEHYFESANGRFFEGVPAAPNVPVPVTVLGMLPSQGAGFDCAPFFNKILLAMANSGCKNWTFPPGSYYFNSRPNDIAVFGIKLNGHSATNASALIKNFVSSGTADAIFNVRDDDFEIRDFRFLALAGSQNPSGFAGTGSMISIVSQTGDSIGYGTIDNIDCTADATLPNGHACNSVHIYCNGTNSAAGAGGGYGIRGIRMTGLKLFGTESYPIWLHDTVSCFVNGPGTFQAGGLSGRVAVTGSSALIKSQGNIIQFAHVSDGLVTNFATGLRIDVGQWDAGVIDIGAETGGIFSGSMLNGATLSNASPDAIFIDPAMPVIESQGTAASGKYRKWSDGRIEQWGGGSTVAGAATVTFPIAFASAVASIQINAIDAPGANEIYLMQAHTVSASGFSVVGRVLTSAPASSAIAGSFRWYATGF